MSRFKIIISLLVSFAVIASCQVYGQMKPTGIAPGLIYEIETHDHEQNVFSLPVSLDKLLLEDQFGLAPGVPYRIGYIVPVYQDLFSMGEWIEMDDGKRFYRAILTSPGAQSVNVAFDEFFLPEGSQLFFYNPSKLEVYGGYTSADNHFSRMFPGPVVEGQTVVVEYVPQNGSYDKSEVALFVKDITHFYRNLNEGFKNSNIGSSGACNININCPEGDLWQDQKRGVARILLRVGNSAGWCSGSLINNTAQDGTPYFLTAEHCGSGASSADHNLWQFRFNFERPGCEHAGIPANQTLTGCQLMAIGSMSGGSDMRLVKLNFTPPASFNPYYNGWDRSAIPASQGVGIHHPAGDVKKISTFSSTATNVANPVVGGISMASNSAWNIFFVSTVSGHGVTEGGSSGSPMFNEDGLIVGTLTGGSSSCSNPAGNNIYGKFSYHWASNGMNNNQQLRHWLDPLGTNQITLQGLDIYPMPKVAKLNASLNLDYSVSLEWERPAYGDMDSWFGYAANYSTVRHDVPQRATFFDFKETMGVDTFYLSRLSHYFWQHPAFPWGSNNKFHFKVYDIDGFTPLYISEELTAFNFQSTNRPVIHVLENPLTLSNGFFVAIVPVSAQPSSLALEVSLTTQSWYGEPGNWSLLQEGDRYFEYLTNVYGSGNASVTEDTESYHSSMYRLGPNSGQIIKTIEPLYHSSTKTEKLLNLITSYRIYRDGVMVGQTDNGGVLFFNDESVLEQERTYSYAVSSVYNLNPSNPNSPFTESELSDPVNIKISFVGVVDPGNEGRGISVFPNPSNGNITISWDSFIHSGVIRLFDLKGNTIRSGMLLPDGDNHLELTGISKGFYLLVLETPTQKYFQKVIVF